MTASKRPTIKDIANDVGVSLSLINRAFNNKSGVSEEMRERIFLSAKKLGYRPNKVAQSMARACIEIGIVMPTTWHEYYAHLKKGIDAEFDRLMDYNVEGQYYYVNNAISSSETINAIRKCINDNVQGIILCDAYPIGLKKVLKETKQHEIPILIVGSFNSFGIDQDDYLCSIQINAEISGAIAAEMLSLSLPRKSDTIVFVGNKDIEEHSAKINGFKSKAQEYGFNVVGIYETQDEPDIIYQIAKKVLYLNDNIKGIYSATANSASICKLIEEMQIPVKVVGTDLCSENVAYLKKNAMQCILYQTLKNTALLQ